MPNIPDTQPSSEEFKTITENLYKQNLELSVINKTLSLLQELYKISIQNLGSRQISARISETIRSSLNFERVSILRYTAELDSLTQIASAESTRFHVARGDSPSYFDNDSTIENASIHAFFSDPISKNQMGYTEDVSLVWGTYVPKESLLKIISEGHVRSVIAFPLIIEDKVVGTWVSILNRPYTELATYEKKSIESISNVIAVALDKALLYEKLRESNEQLAQSNDRLKELDQLKTEFVSIASHQLRAPITAIKGYASLIIEGSFGEVPEALRGASERIFESSKFMATIIEDFLNITRIEQGHIKYSLEDFNVVSLASRVVEEYQHSAHEKKLGLSLESPKTTIIVHADEGKIKQAITNLVDNAIKYTSAGTIRVVINIVPERNNVQIQVIDTGIGISATDQNRLFQKFSRAKNANNVNVLGTGLGLYVVHEMMKVQGGNVSVFSEGEGKGSTFTLEIPLSEEQKSK